MYNKLHSALGLTNGAILGILSRLAIRHPSNFRYQKELVSHFN